MNAPLKLCPEVEEEGPAAGPLGGGAGLRIVCPLSPAVHDEHGLFSPLHSIHSGVDTLLSSPSLVGGRAGGRGVSGGRGGGRGGASRVARTRSWQLPPRAPASPPTRRLPPGPLSRLRPAPSTTRRPAGWAWRRRRRSWRCKARRAACGSGCAPGAARSRRSRGPAPLPAPPPRRGTTPAAPPPSCPTTPATAESAPRCAARRGPAQRSAVQHSAALATGHGHARTFALLQSPLRAMCLFPGCSRWALGALTRPHGPPRLRPPAPAAQLEWTPELHQQFVEAVESLPAEKQVRAAGACHGSRAADCSPGASLPAQHVQSEAGAALPRCVPAEGSVGPVHCCRAGPRSPQSQA